MSPESYQQTRPRSCFRTCRLHFDRCHDPASIRCLRSAPSKPPVARSGEDSALILALTAQRYRIRRRISQLRFLESALLHPVCEVGRRRIVAHRDELLGGPVGEQRLDFRTVLVKLAFTGACRTAERQAGSPSRAKGFFRPRGDQPRSISAAIFPPKSRSKSSPKLGDTKSMIYTPFQ